MQGLPGVIVYIDNILVARGTENEHLKRLDDVLTQLEQAGLRDQRRKCQFMKPSVTFLRHQVGADGLHPLPEKIEAVMKAPTPRIVRELKSFLVLLWYYSKFLPNLSSVLAPLYHLLQKDTAWWWSEKEAEAFQHSNELLTSANVLTHFNRSWPLVLACGASAVGNGAVLAHTLPDRSERPIGYLLDSRSRTKDSRSRTYWIQGHCPVQSIITLSWKRKVYHVYLE